MLLESQTHDKGNGQWTIMNIHENQTNNIQ
jgi:hypothetical protein